LTHIVEMTGITKSFGPVQALAGVSLRLGYGEVLGLVGDNAAGKSTLMKVLSGAHQPDAGTLSYDGRAVRWSSPHDSRLAGIEMVYQDLGLVGCLDITSNIFLGREPTARRLGVQLLDEAAMDRAARDLLSRLKIEIRDVSQRVETLSGGQRQAVAIARATAFDAKVVIMDEPTAALAVKEVGKVLDTIRRLKEHGIAVIIVSHRLQDIFRVCDRVTVLRGGRNAGERNIGETTMDEVVGMIVGAREEADEALGGIASGE
jgi:simple sugar transport system ATP-binding protein